MSRSCCFLFPLVCSVALPAQTTHLVGPGGFAQIREALAVAAPGDRIHVLPGTYAHFAVQAGVTIRALLPGTVDVAYDIAWWTPGCTANCIGTVEGPTTFAVPPGQTAHVIGLRFVANDVAYPHPFWHTIRHRVVVAAGRVHFDECELRSSTTALRAGPGCEVHLRHCTVEAVGPMAAHGIQLASASLTLVGGTVHAARVGAALYSGAGIDGSASTIHASGATIRGGLSLSPAGSGPGIDAIGGALWLHGCVVEGSCAVGSTTPWQHDDCTLVNLDPFCAATAPSSLLGVQQAAAPVAGAPFQLDWHTDPNGFVAVFASPALARVPVPELVVQPVWLDPVPMFFATIVLADAAGAAVTTFALPPGAAFVDTELWLTGVSGFAFPLQASPPVGGILR